MGYPNPRPVPEQQRSFSEDVLRGIIRNIQRNDLNRPLNQLLHLLGLTLGIHRQRYQPGLEESRTQTGLKQDSNRTRTRLKQDLNMTGLNVGCFCVSGVFTGTSCSCVLWLWAERTLTLVSISANVDFLWVVRFNFPI